MKIKKENRLRFYYALAICIGMTASIIYNCINHDFLTGKLILEILTVVALIDVMIRLAKDQ